MDCSPLNSGSIRRRRAVEVEGCTGGHSSAYVWCMYTLCYHMTCHTSSFTFSMLTWIERLPNERSSVFCVLVEDDGFG